jgi:hypothetical protein
MFTPFESIRQDKINQLIKWKYLLKK